MLFLFLLEASPAEFALLLDFVWWSLGKILSASLSWENAMVFLLYLIIRKKKRDSPSIINYSSIRSNDFTKTNHATINQQLNQQQQLLCSYELQYSEPITQWAVPHLPAMHSITWTDARSAVQFNHKGWLCSLQSKRIWTAVGYSLLRWSHRKRKMAQLWAQQMQQSINSSTSNSNYFVPTNCNIPSQ